MNKVTIKVIEEKTYPRTIDGILELLEDKIEEYGNEIPLRLDPEYGVGFAANYKAIEALKSVKHILVKLKEQDKGEPRFLK